VVLELVADAAANLIMPRLLSDEIAATGFSLHQASMIAIIILICALLYAVPRPQCQAQSCSPDFSAVQSALIFDLVSFFRHLRLHAWRWAFWLGVGFIFVMPGFERCCP
jgi:hypothetical protein